jgi:murein L,D-transpeptidase YafK
LSLSFVSTEKKKCQMSRLLLIIIFVFIFSGAYSQSQENTPSYGKSFVDYQKGFKRANSAFAANEANLKALFELKGLVWPARYMYLRSFKYDSQLEVWIKNTIQEEYKLLKVYKVCALSGALGPKRFEGDYQVPEGFYFIDRFNPNSSYYLSLGLNYPNASDKILSDQEHPGSGIYIHGGCATVGCIPILDDKISELYVLTAGAKSVGLDYIPVHIFPIKYNEQKSYEYLARITKDNEHLKEFTDRLEEAYDYFEKYHQIPVVMIKDNGEYVVNNSLPKVPKFVQVVKVRPKSDFVPVVRDVTVANVVTKWPEFPGGIQAFETYLKNLGQEMVPMLPEETRRLYAQVEFIIDADGTSVNFKMIQGGDEYFNKELMKRMQKMEKWQPAMSDKTPVPKKIVQTVVVGE